MSEPTSDAPAFDRNGKSVHEVVDYLWDKVHEILGQNPEPPATDNVPSTNLPSEPNVVQDSSFEPTGANQDAVTAQQDPQTGPEAIESQPVSESTVTESTDGNESVTNP